MSRSESWKIWVAVIAILVLSGLLTAVWPAVSGLIGGGAGMGGGGISLQSETITIVVPALPGLPVVEPIVLPSFLAFILLGVVIGGAIVVTGLVLAGINLILSRQSTKVLNSEKYQAGAVTLQQRESARLEQKRQGRAAATSQQRDYTRWAVIATSLAMLLFAAFLGFLVASSLFPTGVVVEEDQIINVQTLIVAASVLITLLVLLLYINPRRLADLDQSDGSGIPWDSIAVLLLGILVVGLGIGLMVLLNQPG